MILNNFSLLFYFTNFQKYLDDHRKLQESLLEFIEKEGDSNEEFDFLKELIGKQNYKEDDKGLSIFLHVLANIANNHHASKNLLERIENAIEYQLRNFTI